MPITEFTSNELKNELTRRQNEEHDNKMNQLPEEFYPYKEVKDFDLTDKNYQLFTAHIDDGCEGIEFLIKLNHGRFGSTEDDDELIENAVKHHWLSISKEGGWDPNFYNISIGEIGRYSRKLLEINKK